MAGTLLHVTLAERARDMADSVGSSNPARERPQDFRLGSVLVDLPFYNQLLFNGARMMLKRGPIFNVWGSLVHVRSPSALCLALLDEAHGASGQALALGALTHQAVDVVFHEEINRRVMALADGSKTLDELHKHIEDQMDLYIHYHLLRHSGLGTAYARRLILRPDSGWVRQTTTAWASVHGAAPRDRQLRGWLRNLGLFGVLNSSPFVPWVKTMPDDDPRLQETSIALAERAVEKATGYLTAGTKYLAGDIDRTGFLTAVPDRSMADGGPPEPPRSTGR